jgi:hypothetical protein
MSTGTPEVAQNVCLIFQYIQHMLYVLEDQTHILGNLRSTRGHNQICTYVYMYSVPSHSVRGCSWILRIFVFSFSWYGVHIYICTYLVMSTGTPARRLGNSMLYVLEDQTHILGNLRSTRGHNQICTYVCLIFQYIQHRVT